MCKPLSIRALAARTVLWAGIVTGACAPALAQQEATYAVPQFGLEAGGVLENMKIGYVTWGQRAPDDSNVIVLLPPTSGLKNWANAHIGKGKSFDPERHFIVSIDAIGGGSSSQPRDGLGSRFPVYNIRDMVKAQHRLLTQGLGIQQALAIGGASSGAYQALEWGVLYPGFARGLLLYAGRHARQVHRRRHRGDLESGSGVRIGQCEPRRRRCGATSIDRVLSVAGLGRILGNLQLG